MVAKISGEAMRIAAVQNEVAGGVGTRPGGILPEGDPRRHAGRIRIETESQINPIDEEIGRRIVRQAHSRRLGLDTEHGRFSRVASPGQGHMRRRNRSRSGLSENGGFRLK